MITSFGEELLRFQKHQRFLGYDYETCSLALSNTMNTPWQLGTALYEGKTLLGEREHWIGWEHPFIVAPEAARITHFSWDKYHEKKRPAADIRVEFEKYFYDPNVINVGANIFGFDHHIDQLYLELLGKPRNYSAMRRSICIQVLHKAIELQVKPPKFGTDEWLSFCFQIQNYHERGLKSSLRHLCDRYGVEYRADLHHVSALWDLTASIEIMQKQLWMIEI